MGPPSSSSLFLAPLVAAVVLTSCMVHVADAQNSPSDWVRLHNAERRRLGVPPVSWDSTVATYARWYANERRRDCQLVHSREAGRLYGENLFAGGDSGLTGAADAMELWVDEEKWYDCPTNTCATDGVCGHYTQVMWSRSTKIGCARVVCDDGGAVFMTCNYSPPRNFPGERPYRCPCMINTTAGGKRSASA